MGFLGIVYGLAHCIYFPQMVFLLDILLQKKKADANEHQPFSIFNQFYAGITAKFIIAQEKPVSYNRLILGDH